MKFSNPQLYRPGPQQHAWHPQPGFPDAQQSWFHDAVFENGYCMESMFHFTPARITLWLHICDPQGNVTRITPTFTPDAATVSREEVDVKVGDNYLRGKSPTFEIRLRSGDVGIEATIESMTDDFREPPDGVFIGREQRPATPVYFGFVYRPRCRVTGKLFLGGKEIPVRGQGHGDHQWSNRSAEQLPMYYWYYSRIFHPTHTIVWWDTHLNQTFGFERKKWLWVYRDRTLLEYRSNATMFVEPSEFEVEPESGLAFPRKTVFMVDEPAIRGTATYTRKLILENIPSTGFDNPKDEGSVKGGWKRYLRYLSTCEARFEIDGEKVESTTTELQEIAT